MSNQLNTSLINWVYTDADPQRRIQNCNELRDIGRGWRKGWACMGDCNVISYHHELERGRRKSQQQMDEFNAMVEDIQMEDLGAKGSRFTWSNNLWGEERVSELIGRVLINSIWAALYSDVQCINDLAIGSDHTPIILHRAQGGQRRRSQFCFEDMWPENAECKDVIREA